MSTRYIFRECTNGFRRAKLASTGSVLTMIISLLFLSLFYLFSTITGRIINDLRGRVEMEVFLDEPVSSQSVNVIQGQLLALEGVDHVRFVSKDDAAKIFKQEFGEDINGVLEFNPLPPSFKVYLKEIYRTTDKADQVQKKILAIHGVDKILYRHDLLEMMERQTRTLGLIGLAIGVLVGISAVFLVSNTIRLTIHAKRKTILTMKLVGATRWFVRAPFLLEGFLQGAAAGLVTAGVMFCLMMNAEAFLSKELLPYLPDTLLLYVGVVCAGMVLGLFGSAVSVRRYIGDSLA